MYLILLVANQPCKNLSPSTQGRSQARSAVPRKQNMLSLRKRSQAAVFAEMLTSPTAAARSHPCSGCVEVGAWGTHSPVGLLAEECLGCVSAPGCAPQAAPAGKRGRQGQTPALAASKGSGHSLVEKEAHAPSPSCIPSRGCHHVPRTAGKWGEGSLATVSPGGDELWCPGTSGSSQNLLCPDASSQQRGCQQMVLQPTLPRSLVCKGYYWNLSSCLGERLASSALWFGEWSSLHQVI